MDITGAAAWQADGITVITPTARQAYPPAKWCCMGARACCCHTIEFMWKETAACHAIFWVSMEA